MKIGQKITDPVTDEEIEVYQNFQFVRAKGIEQAGTIIEMTMVDGVLHSVDDNPSYRVFDEETGQDHHLAWHKNGLMSRSDGKPTMLMYFDNGNLCTRCWCVDGKGHRVGGPYLEEFSENGRPVTIHYQQNGRDYRPDGPAFLEINEETGITFFEYWCTDISCDNSHREDGPAHIGRDSETGIITESVWVQRGLLFRPDGQEPVIYRDGQTGKITKKSWSHRLYESPPKSSLFPEYNS